MLAARMPFGDDAGAVRVIAITSVSDGEGRTTVAWELALAAVEAGRQVVVVDLERGDEDDDDDEDPSRRGFWDYVAGSAELDDVIATSPLDNLHFVADTYGLVIHAEQEKRTIAGITSILALWSAGEFGVTTVYGPRPAVRTRSRTRRR